MFETYIYLAHFLLPLMTMTASYSLSNRTNSRGGSKRWREYTSFRPPQPTAQFQLPVHQHHSSISCHRLSAHKIRLAQRHLMLCSARIQYFSSITSYPCRLFVCKRNILHIYIYVFHIFRFVCNNL